MPSERERLIHELNLLERNVQWDFTAHMIRVADFILADRKRILDGVERVVDCYDEYVGLLAEELDELVILATSHGWKTSRFEQGKMARSRIDEALAKIAELRGSNG